MNRLQSNIPTTALIPVKLSPHQIPKKKKTNSPTRPPDTITLASDQKSTRHPKQPNPGASTPRLRFFFGNPFPPVPLPIIAGLSSARTAIFPRRAGQTARRTKIQFLGSARAGLCARARARLPTDECSSRASPRVFATSKWPIVCVHTERQQRAAPPPRFLCLFGNFRCELRAARRDIESLSL